MKANTVRSNTNLVFRRSVYLAAFGALGFSAQLACSDAPATNGAPQPGVGGSGTPGGAPGASGSSASGGGGSGGGGGTGTSLGGTAGTSSTGGTGVVVVPPPYCDGKTPSPLPFEVTTSFYPSAWQGDFTEVSIPADLTENACDARSAGAIGECSKWRYTPNAATPTWAGVGWSTKADDKFTHEPVCLANNATKVTFQARGADGGEAITVAAAGSAEISLKLTAEWKTYEIPLAGVKYNTPEIGISTGFFWKAVPLDAPNVTPITTFFIDDIQVVSGDTPPGGEGGMGGVSGDGAGGAGGAGGAP